MAHRHVFPLTPLDRLDSPGVDASAVCELLARTRTAKLSSGIMIPFSSNHRQPRGPLLHLDGEPQRRHSRIRRPQRQPLQVAHGTITLAVSGHTDEYGEWLAFGVTDTGIGMSEAQLGKLCQPFRQAEATTQAQYGGTGLGRPLSREYCRLMGGDITVTSAPGQGSTFTITLPRRAAQTPA
jgi:hypothetical protein